MRAGDVLIVDFGAPIGSQPGLRRPAIVLTADAVLDYQPNTIHVVPVTSNVERSWDSDVRVEAAGLDGPSVAQCHLLGVISVERVADRDGGNVGPATLFALREMVADLLDIPR
jgi:mRNA interferase MazF